jgi:hypothetical protein
MASGQANMSSLREEPEAAIDLYWLPLRAGGHSVRLKRQGVRGPRRSTLAPQHLRPLPLGARYPPELASSLLAPSCMPPCHIAWVSTVIANDEMKGKELTEEDRDWLAERFEEHRTHLRAVGYRMLGSLSEADDAVQEA